MSIDRRILAGTEYQKQLVESRRGFVSDQYYPECLPNFDISASSVEVLAYYLPQFHPFRENDEWWGKGFTEWTNVTRAKPQFIGHYQPHLPADLGFYDLRNPETMQNQIDLAKAYGVTGFIFYYYWFDGRRVLERPLDLFLSHKELDMKFSLCWANENWTRRWDGAEHEVLLGQTHTAESDERFIIDVIEYMKDSRYIHIDGRPLLTIYRIGLLPNLEETVERWRAVARKELGVDLFLVYAMTFGEQRVPENIGFDAAIQFPPHATFATNISEKVEPFSSDFAGSVFDYQSIASSARSALQNIDFPLIPGVFPSWDNTARRGENGHLFVGSSPDTYGAWLSEAAHHAYRKPIFDRSIVVVNAWNEWAEGAHLEPDQRVGHAYLRTTADILRPYTPFPTRDVYQAAFRPTACIRGAERQIDDKLAIIIHAHYADALENILKDIPENQRYKLFITLSEKPNSDVLAKIAVLAPEATLILLPNKGRDVRPFLSAINIIADCGYRYFIKLHTKKSVHRSDGEIWSEELYKPFCNTIEAGIIENFFDNNPQVAIIAPTGHVLSGSRFMGSAQNYEWLQKLYLRYGITQDIGEFDFVAGSMFAGRVDDYLELSSDGWLANIFEEEMGRRDGTLAHALERFFGAKAHFSGRIIANLDADGLKISDSRFSSEQCYRFAETQSWNNGVGGNFIDTTK